MNTLKSTIPNQLVFTDRAALQTHDLISQEENKTLNLRLFVVGSGCAGLQYGFAFDENKSPDDTLVQKTIDLTDEKKSEKQVTMIIDPISFLYLNTATVDYNGERFTVDNPHIKTTCGCARKQMAEDEQL